MPRKRSEIKLRMVCENCGKQQKPNFEKSNSNWNVYDCNQKCECGGKFVMKFGDDL